MELSTPIYETAFQGLSACVLIPTFNNDAKLEAVLISVLQYTSQVIVVNDGSTDNTRLILKRFPGLEVVDYVLNQGKGHALQLGFRHAQHLGYKYAITMDSDGQHYASDLPSFLAAIRQNPKALIIGARNMQQENVPGKSSFGNRFSNFWFWVETGIRLPDTQSGYRSYPLESLAQLRYFSKKYEFEIEVPVRLAWRGIDVICIPIAVYYPPPEERITHFRPFRDFVRISILNTFLTFMALFWIHPRDFFLKINNKGGRQQLYRQIFHDPAESKQKKALSIAFGIFMGIFPVWGFQLAIGIPLALYFKLNKTLFLIAANISIFPVTPVIWALSLLTGKVILAYDDWTFRFKDVSLEQFKEAGIAFFLGGAVLAVICAFIAYMTAILVLKSGKSQRKVSEEE